MDAGAGKNTDVNDSLIFPEIIDLIHECLSFSASFTRYGRPFFRFSFSRHPVFELRSSLVAMNLTLSSFGTLSRESF